MNQVRKESKVLSGIVGRKIDECQQSADNRLLVLIVNETDAANTRRCKKSSIIDRVSRCNVTTPSYSTLWQSQCQLSVVRYYQYRSIRVGESDPTRPKTIAYLSAVPVLSITHVFWMRMRLNYELCCINLAKVYFGLPFFMANRGCCFWFLSSTWLAAAFFPRSRFKLSGSAGSQKRTIHEPEGRNEVALLVISKK